MHKTIVVARYKEDINWIKKLNQYFDVVVYNKYYDEEIKLPNKGREAHTYLHHIIKNYKTLDSSGFTVFTQANPFDHSPHFIENVNYLTDANGFKWLTSNFHYSNKTAGTQETIECDIYARPHDYLDMRKFWEFFFGSIPCPSKFVFGPGAIFVCSNQIILQKPISFYENCLNSFDIMERTPWALERLWSYIFDTSNISTNKI